MTNQQIVKLYEDSNLAIEELASVFSIEPEAVKLALVNGSTKYRAELKKDPSLFTEADLDSAVMTMNQLLTAEQEGVRYRAAKFIINEKKGRHDIKNVKNLNLNVNIFNDQMRMEKMKRAMAIVEPVTTETITDKPESEHNGN